MASHGITDLAAVINIPKSEYEDLIRDSETLKVVRRILEKTPDNTPVLLVKDILGVESEEKGNEEKGVILYDADGCYHAFGKIENCTGI